MKIAVIGGGIAGAELLRVASPCPLEFTLIEPKKQVEMQALYPEYLGGAARLQDHGGSAQALLRARGSHAYQIWAEGSGRGMKGSWI